MPFGLCNAPATFQRMMDEVLEEVGWKIGRDYIDDLIIGSKSFEEHLEHIERLFGCLQKAKLQVKLSKCRFGRRKVIFLGHEVSDQGVRPNPAKVEAIQKMLPPTDIKGLRRFLGMTSYYRRFIQNYATIAEPLNRILQKGALYKWNDACQAAFEALKSKLMTAPILVFPDFNQPFQLITDASDFGLGAVLAQKDKEGLERVVAYASRTLQKPERRYSVTEKECLAVVWATGMYRPYLFGRPFEVITDHSALQYIKSIKDMEGRLGRWSLKLQEYDMTITPRPGKLNQNADALSRIGENNVIRLLKDSPIRDRLQKLQNIDVKLGALIRFLQAQILPEDESLANWVVKVAPGYELVEGILYRSLPNHRMTKRGSTQLRVVVPRALQDLVLKTCHDSSTAGHLGIKRTYN